MPVYIAADSAAARRLRALVPGARVIISGSRAVIPEPPTAVIFWDAAVADLKWFGMVFGSHAKGLAQSHLHLQPVAP